MFKEVTDYAEACLLSDANLLWWKYQSRYGFGDGWRPVTGTFTALRDANWFSARTTDFAVRTEE